MQEIFAEKTSTALEIVMEAGFEPKKISFRGHFIYKHGLPVLSLEEPNLRVRKIVVLMFFIPFGTNYINPASANVSTMKICY